MKYIVYIFLFLLMGMTVRAQLPSSTFPSRVFNGNTKAQWIILDSPAVNPILDTFNARYPGTQLVRIQGGDTAFWFGAGGHLWFRSLLSRDTVSLSNRINLKLNITDTANKWWGIGKRWVDTVYRVNDSTVGYTINGSPYTFEIKGGAQGGGGGTGTVTSVGLSMPSAFSVTPSTITSSGTFNVSGAGTSAQYIRGNGTLATTDTGMIPNFYVKARSLFSGTSPITYNSTTGLLGVLRANTSGQLGVASFNNSDFVDNGAGLISLRNSTGGAGVDTILRIPGVDSIYFTISGVQYAIKDSSGMVVYASNGLSKNADTVQLGQTVGAVGNPAALSSSREIPLNGFNTVFTGTGGLAIGTSTVGNRKLNISATSTTQGANVTTVDGTGINVVASGTGNAMFGQAGGTGTGVTGSNSGSSGYGLVGVSSSNSAIPFKANNFSTLTNSATPVVAEFVRNVTGIPADGVGLTVMFRGQTTTTTDVEMGQIRSYFSTALHGSRSSAFEFHLVNNAVSARKAFLASTGQWTWDGYPGLTAQIDTTTYKPVAIDGSGNVVKMAGWAGSGGGGGAILNNIGTGGAWAATPSGNIKRAANSNTITWDSTSTANSLTAKVDTSYIATRSICQWPNERRLDTFYKKNNWINGNDFTIHGAALLSSNGNFLDLSGGDGTYGSNYITFSNVTMLSKWKMVLLIKLTGALVSGGGLAAGLKYVNSNAQYDIQGSFAFNTTGSTPIYIATTRGGGTVYQTSGGSMSFSQNDVIKLEFEFNDSSFTVSETNITTAASPVSTTYSWANPTVAAGQIPNTCSFAIFPIKGAQQIQSITLSSAETQFASVAMIGDSKDQLGFASSFSSRIGNEVNSSMPTTITRAGEGDGVTQTMAGLPEIKLLSPRIALLNIGSNSIRQGMNVYQVFSAYDSIVKSIASTGIQVYHMVMPEDTVDNPTSAVGMSLFKQMVQSTYGAFYMNKIWDTLADNNNRLKAAFDSGDGVHLNQAGIDATVVAILSSNKLTVCPSRVRDDYFIAGTLTNSSTSTGIAIGGTDNYILKKSGGNTANSLLYDAGTGVGLGTTTPINKLEITGNDFTNSIVKFGSAEIQSAEDCNSFVSNNGHFNGTNWRYATNGGASIYQLYRDSLVIYLLPAGTAGGTINQSLYKKIEIGPREFRSKIPIKTLDSITFFNLTAPPSTYNILVHGLTDSLVYQVPASLFGGISSLNALTASTQTFATGTSGSDFNINSSTSTHTFNIPSASTSNRGLVTTAGQTFGGQKTFNDGIVATSGVNPRVTINGNVSTTIGPSTYGDGLLIDFITHTNTGAATTISDNENFNFIANPTLTSPNAISYTGDVATVRFVGAPVAAGSTTISHPWNILANDVNYFAGVAMSLNEQTGSVTLSNASGINIYTGTGGSTWTLPALATHPGKFIFIKNAGSGNLTVQRAGSDNIYETSSVTSITIAAGASRMFAAGSAFWYVCTFN